MGDWEEDHRGEVPVPSHCPLSSQVVVTWITWSKWCLPTLFTVKLPFSSLHTLLFVRRRKKGVYIHLLVRDVSTYTVWVSSGPLSLIHYVCEKRTPVPCKFLQDG